MFAGNNFMKRIKQKQNTVDKAKKSYKRPELTVYGTINQITESVTGGKNADGGTGKLSMSAS
jgi:hypothetical protein